MLNINTLKELQELQEKLDSLMFIISNLKNQNHLLVLENAELKRERELTKR
jgi:hypothetical protein